MPERENCQICQERFNPEMLFSTTSLIDYTLNWTQGERTTWQLCGDCNDEYAVNLYNENTIEFRIFASTTNYETFMMRLEFVAATINFCEQSSIKNLTWLNFRNWMKGRNKQYYYLANFLKTSRIAA